MRHFYATVSFVIDPGGDIKAPSATLDASGDMPAASTRVTSEMAFTRARQLFAEGSKLDMLALAKELRIGRATLYRWMGDREQLLADVIATELIALIDYLEESTSGRGVSHLEGVAAGFLDVLTGNPGLHAFLRNESDMGFRMVTNPKGPIRPLLVNAACDVIQLQVDSGNYLPPVDPRLLADGVVSLAERFLYHGGEAELNPDPETAKQMIALLLREPCPQTGGNQ